MQKMEADPGWSWTRKAIADLLSAGFENRAGSIPIDFRQKVWTILKPLTDDPDPTPEDEQRYGCFNMDPATLSINTTRGRRCIRSSVMHCGFGSTWRRSQTRKLGFKMASKRYPRYARGWKHTLTRLGSHRSLSAQFMASDSPGLFSSIPIGHAHTQ